MFLYKVFMTRTVEQKHESRLVYGDLTSSLVVAELYSCAYVVRLNVSELFRTLRACPPI